MYPFNRFSENAKGVLTRAQREAERGGQSYIGTEHLLLGLMGEADGLAGRALAEFGLQLPQIRATMERVLGSNPPPAAQQIIPTSRVKRIIELAFEVARRENSSIVDTGHLLLAVVEEGEGVAAQVLRDQGVTADRTRRELAVRRQRGEAEVSQTETRPHTSRRRHLDVEDRQGRLILIDIMFPPGYEEAESSELEARVRAAVKPPEG